MTTSPYVLLAKYAKKREEILSKMYGLPENQTRDNWSKRIIFPSSNS
ncbi:hypothetical protein JL09_g6761 [Pichia kudriavzevii]|uniref:Uncharacterized protein n=1 Tax=Pichia kudriavzevii TaxID=4909 RepID=A0A099NL22_PICKU|nr:hypothetical protein JL09_g6761 [Pichia kudriavzevii]